MLLEAEDNAGQITDFCLKLIPRNTANVYARFENPQGQYLVGVQLYLMPQDWVPAVAIDLSQAVDLSVSDGYYRCHFEDVQLGLNHFVAVYGAETFVNPYVTNPAKDWNQIPEDGYIYVLGD